jgi:hypothetical protein
VNLSTLCGLQAQHKLDGHTSFQGLPVSIENKKGSVRKGKCEKGKPHTCWRTKLQAHYGYIRGVPGVDGDSLDVFIGPDANATTAYIVITKKAPEFEKPDEHKVLLGWNSADAAKKALIENYGGDARHFGSMTAMPMSEFKQRVGHPNFRPQKLTASKLEQAMRAMEGPVGMAHIDPIPSFHPPSLKNPKRVPVDDPMEKDDSFLDVTKRTDKATQRFRLQQTKKHPTLGGIPPNTAVAHHTGSYLGQF